MQNLARDEAGNVWEIDAAGNPLRMVEPAVPQQGRVFSLPQSPKEAAEEARKNAAADRAERREDRAEENAAVANRLKEQEIALKRQQEEREGNTAKQISDWRTNLSNIGLLERTIADLRRQYKEHFEGKGLQSIAEEFAPGRFSPQYKVFDTDAQSVLADMAKAKGLTAQQFNTPAEQRMFFEPLIPKRGDPDEVILSKLDNLERMVATGRATTEQHLGIATQKADNEVPDPTTGADLKPPPNDGSPPDMAPENGARTTAATGDTRTTFDARMSSQIDSLINAGASKATIDAILKRQDFPVLTPAEWSAVQTWRKQNPGKRYYGANISRVDDLSMMQRAAGSEAGAFLAHMGNTATAGIPAALAGPTGQGALDAMAEASPNASLVGGTLGGVTGAVGAEAAVAARAPAALARYAPRIADTLYGGLLGFNTAQEGEGAQGALLGAGAGLAGGFVGDRVLRGVASMTSGVRNPHVQALRDRGIPLTVGQTVGDSGRIGSAVKSIEDALTSVPGVGNMIDARRVEGLEAFNRAAFQDAAAPGATITATGAPGMAQVRQSVSDAYDRALNPVTIDPSDPQFIADVAAARAAAQSSIRNVEPTRPQDFATGALDSRITGNIDPATGMMSGRNFQEAYRGLARTGRERANSDYGHEVGQVMRQGQDALAEALERQNPGAFGEFLEANAANRRANVLAQALGNAGNQVDELITPAQLNRADIASTSRLEGKINSASGNRPFYDLATAGQEVLPSRLPDSGTAKRAIVGALTTGTLGGTGMAFGGQEGAGIGTGGGLLLSAALALGGTRAGQRALTSMVADRPDFAAALADAIRSDLGRRIGGSAGAGTATALTAY